MDEWNGISEFPEPSEASIRPWGNGEQVGKKASYSDDPSNCAGNKVLWLKRLMGETGRSPQRY